MDNRPQKWQDLCVYRITFASEKHTASVSLGFHVTHFWEGMDCAT